MRAIFTGSTAATATSPDSGTNTATSQVSSPPTPAVSISSPEDDHFPRRVKSKSSLRSIRSVGSSHHEDEGQDSQDLGSADKTLVRPSFLRRLSPGLVARVKLLDGSNKTTSSSRNVAPVGRIPEEHIKVLDSLHQDLSIKIQKKGVRSWNNLHVTGQEKEHQHGGSNYLEVLEQDFVHVESEQESEPVVPVPVPITENSGSLTTLSPSHTAATPLDPELPASSQEDLEYQEEAQEAQEVEEVKEVEEVEAVEELEGLKELAEETSAVMSVFEPPPAPLGLDSTTVSDQQDQTDYERYIQSTTESEEQPPPPPPKDSSPPPSSSSSNAPSYFNPLGLQRTESIYSFSRASFSNQLSQLTSITLPEPTSLAASIAGIPNAPAAVRALTGAAEQIQIWIRKASDVLSGLDAEDDVEWAAAGGREGLEGVDKAITTFEGLVNVYVNAIEDVQVREDIADVGSDSLKTIVIQMDAILQSWAQIKASLKGVKEQVELAMEWEELWSNVLGDVSNEVDSLSRLVFEMEEKRHFNLSSEQEIGCNGLDINELETIVEETPTNMHSSKRFSMGPIFSTPPALGMPIIQTPQDDSSQSNLMALFARMQPLRASLDFLPMRMSMFQSRAQHIFPSACEELDDRRKQLEENYKVLEVDAEALRKELGEDRWILVFRNAGGQAQKMFDSVERSIGKLQEGLETGMHLHNPAGLIKRVESYEAKKVHYVPAIERVISIIQKGVNDRLTVNGETLRLLSDMTSRVDALKASVKVMDSSLEDINFVKSHQLRDSISSIITMDSPLASSVIDTPGSSPASSVIMTSGSGLKGASTPLGTSSRRSSAGSSTARMTLSKVRRFSGLPQAAAKSAIPKPTFTSSSPSKRDPAATPTPAARTASRLPPPSPSNNRPRWITSTNTNDLDIGHKYSTPLRKSSAPSYTTRSSSTIPMPSPFRRDQSSSPAPSLSRSMSRISSRLASRSPARTGSPTPSRSILGPPPYGKLQNSGAGDALKIPRNRQSYAGSPFRRSVSQIHDPALPSPTKSVRPGTALGHSANRRISLLPLPKPRSGRDSAAGSRSKTDDRPPWR